MYSSPGLLTIRCVTSENPAFCQAVFHLLRHDLEIIIPGNARSLRCSLGGCTACRFQGTCIFVLLVCDHLSMLNQLESMMQCVSAHQLMNSRGYETKLRSTESCRELRTTHSSIWLPMVTNLYPQNNHEKQKHLPSRPKEGRRLSSHWRSWAPAVQRTVS